MEKFEWLQNTALPAGSLEEIRLSKCCLTFAKFLMVFIVISSKMEYLSQPFCNFHALLLCFCGKAQTGTFAQYGNG